MEEKKQITERKSTSRKFWWKESIFYNIWVKSFKDGNNDGEGDLYGMYNKLDILHDLGVDTLWITPFYESPCVDEGYDISNYYKINKKYGDMEILDKFMKKAKKLGMKILLDLVPNHCSDKHEWFIKALEGDKKYKDFFIWRKGKGKDEKEFPNNWGSIFGGPTWTYVPKFKEFYFHMFAKEQPDLNWENKDMREEYYKIIRFWNKKGIDGYRVDALSHISKPMDFPDYESKDKFVIGKMHFNGPRLEEFCEEINKVIKEKKNNVILGEAAGMDSITMDRFNDPDENKLDLHLCLEHVTVDYDMQNISFKYNPPKEFCLVEFKKIFIRNYKNTINGWNSVYFTNYDYVRPISKIGNDKKFREEIGKMLALLLLTLQGTPIIYQGEEIGMTNWDFEEKDYRDCEVKNYKKLLVDELKMYTNEEYLRIVRRVGRDNTRFPLQWDNTENGGFTKNKPWAPLNPNYTTVNIESSIKNKKSIWNFYKNFILLRKQYIDELVYGEIEIFLKDCKKLFVFKRQKFENKYLFVIASFCEDFVDFDFKSLGIDFGKVEVVRGSYEKDLEVKEVLKLRPYEAVLFRVNE